MTENHIDAAKDTRCGTCQNFKRSFPNSKRLAEHGLCYWKLPRGVVLPSSFVRRPVVDSHGTSCKQWTPV